MWFFDFMNKVVVVIADLAMLICLALVLKLVVMRLNNVLSDFGFNFGGRLQDLYDGIFGSEQVVPPPRPATRRNQNAQAGLADDDSQDATRLRLQRDINRWIDRTENEGRERQDRDNRRQP